VTRIHRGVNIDTGTVEYAILIKFISLTV